MPRGSIGSGYKRDIMSQQRTHILQVSALLVALIAVLVSVFLQRESEALVAAGYLGVLVFALVSAVSLIPGPSLVVAFLAGGTLSPFLVSIAGGLGSAIGETFGYFAGYGSHSVITTSGVPQWVARWRWYQWLNQQVFMWMQRNSFLTIFSMAAIPNFFVDVVGVIAGRAKYPILRFFFAMFLGKSVRFALAAYLGTYFF